MITKMNDVFSDTVYMIDREKIEFTSELFKNILVKITIFLKLNTVMFLKKL